MDHFRKASANIHQEDQYNNPSLSAVNAVALAGGLSWTESFEILLAQARRYGLMPDDPKCVRNMLADAGYVRVPGFRRLGSYAELSGFLLRNYPGAARAVAQTALAGNGIRKKRFCAVRRLPDPAEGFVSMDTREEERHILSLWLDYRDAGAEKPVPEIPEMSPEDVHLSHQGYLYFQPNPLKNVIGDCVIRAYCAVFGQSWETTLDMLARSCEYKNTLLNGLTIYRSLTSEYEFDPRSRLTEAGKGLTGVEFCDRMTLMCRGGERFFAHMGSTHVVGIIPAVIDGKKQYAVADSWDSSGRRIGSYWIYRPADGKKKTVPEPAEKPRPLLFPGELLVHPAFGKGVVLEVLAGGDRVCVHFPRHGDRVFAGSWVRANCLKAEEGLSGVK